MRVRIVAALLVLAAGPGCFGTLRSAEGGTEFVAADLPDQVAFDHGCPRERVVVIRSFQGDQADLDVCGRVRRYRCDPLRRCFDVTNDFPPDALPKPVQSPADLARPVPAPSEAAPHLAGPPPVGKDGAALVPSRFKAAATLRDGSGSLVRMIDAGEEAWASEKVAREGRFVVLQDGTSGFVAAGNVALFPPAPPPGPGPARRDPARPAGHVDI